MFLTFFQNSDIFPASSNILSAASSDNLSDISCNILSDISSAFRWSLLRIELPRPRFKVQIIENASESLVVPWFSFN